MHVEGHIGNLPSAWPPDGLPQLSKNAERSILRRKKGRAGRRVVPRWLTDEAAGARNRLAVEPNVSL